MKRWPIIRHIRWFYLNIQVHRYARMWARHGIGIGHPHPSDLKHLDAIWKGKA